MFRALRCDGRTCGVGSGFLADLFFEQFFNCALTHDLPKGDKRKFSLGTPTEGVERHVSQLADDQVGADQDGGQALGDGAGRRPSM